MGIATWRQYLPHALVHNRVSPRFTNYEIRPLDDDDGNEERSVACVFQCLSIAVCLKNKFISRKINLQIISYPFLSIRVLEIINRLRVPHLPNPEQIQRQETIFRHDDKVHEESSSRLNHADLTVSHRDKSAKEHPPNEFKKKDSFETNLKS